MRTFAVPILLLSFLSGASFCSAQFVEKADLSPFSGIVRSPDYQMQATRPLLDPQNFTLHHQMQIGTTQWGGNSVSTGLFLSQMDVHLRQGLDVRLSMGVAGMLQNNSLDDNSTQNLVGGAELVWRPSEHFQLHIAARRGMPTTSSYWASPFSDYGINSYLQH